MSDKVNTLCLSFTCGPMILALIWWFISLLASKVESGEPEKQDNVIRSDVPNHPEAAVDRTADKVFNRLTGGEKWYPGMTEDLHLYAAMPAPDDRSGGHKQGNLLHWMLEGGRAASVGVKIHLVPVDEQDRISAMRDRSTAWINPPTEGFDPETGIIDEGKGISTEHTPGAGLWGFLQFVALAVSILFVGGSFFALLYYVNEILFPALGW